MKFMNQSINNFKIEIDRMKSSYSMELNAQKQLLENQQKESIQKVLTEIKVMKEEIDQLKSSYSKELNIQKESLNRNEIKQNEYKLYLNQSIQEIKSQIEQMKLNYSNELNEQKQLLNKNENKQNENSIVFASEIQIVKKEIEQMKLNYSNKLNEQKQISNAIENQLNENIIKINEKIEIIKSSFSNEMNEKKQALIKTESSQTEKLENIIKDVQPTKSKKKLKKAPKRRTNTKSPKILASNSTSQVEEEQNNQVQILNESSNQNTNNQFFSPKNLSLSKNDESDNKSINCAFKLSVKQNLFKPSTLNEIQSVIEPICTFEVTGKSFIKQKVYTCSTCAHYRSNEGMCEICARTCHKEHNVVFKGMEFRFYCDCQLKGDCKHHLQKRNLTCTSETYNGKPINQPMYKCNQCNCNSNKYICQYCAIRFHHGHRLEFLGVVENRVCENKKNEQFKPNSE